MTLSALLWFSAAQAQSLSCRDAGTRETGNCEALMKVIEPVLSQTKRVDPQVQLKLIAEAMRRTNSGWGVTRFSLGENGLTNNYCCSCVPGEDCSAQDITDVCSPAPSGSDTCPGGEFRAVCTEQFCTGIDN